MKNIVAAKEIIAFAIVALLTISTGALAFTGSTTSASAENTVLTRLG